MNIPKKRRSQAKSSQAKANWKHKVLEKVKKAISRAKSILSGKANSLAEERKAQQPEEAREPNENTLVEQENLETSEVLIQETSSSKEETKESNDINQT